MILVMTEINIKTELLRPFPDHTQLPESDGTLDISKNSQALTLTIFQGAIA